MLLNIFKRVGGFVVLVLLQVLVLNHIHLFGYATPFLYIYLILKMNTDASRSGMLLWAFALGLTIDVFTNTPGMNAMATVFLAFVRPYIANAFLPRDAVEGLEPSFRTLGFANFTKYVTLCVVIHHSLLLMVEYFTFVGIGQTLLRIACCSLLTILLVLAICKVSE